MFLYGSAYQFFSVLFSTSHEKMRWLTVLFLSKIVIHLDNKNNIGMMLGYKYRAIGYITGKAQTIFHDGSLASK
jgi:hypothetical protein